MPLSNKSKLILNLETISSIFSELQKELPSQIEKYEKMKALENINNLP